MTTTTTTTPSLAERMTAVIPEAVAVQTKDGHETVEVPPARFADAARYLNEHDFVRFIDVTCVDEVLHSERADRFCVHLVVYSMKQQRWARVQAHTTGPLPSVTSIYPAAHNYEREVYDLFGVVFDGHPRLTRILLPDGWQGHPLRRDAPMVVEPVDFTITRDVYRT